MTMRESAALDRWITGNWGEDYFRDAKCPDCYGRLRENEDGYYCPKCGWVEDDGSEPEPPTCECGGGCHFDGQVWRCGHCDTPHEVDGTAIRFKEAE